MRSVFIKLRELLVELKENSPHMKKIIMLFKRPRRRKYYKKQQ